MIELKSVNCYYDKKPVVKDIHLHIQEGEMVSLVGPSGCGKTTLLKAICGLHEAIDGTIHIGGQSVVRLPVHKRSAIMVFQEYLLYPHLDVVENIGFGLKMQGMKKKVRYEKVRPLLEKMGLEGLGHRYPNELSGGQRQRVALARALVVEPKVLLLDEPFSNLDEHLRDEMRRFVCDLQEELGITTIFVTHDIEEALMSSSRVVVMLNGEIQQIARPKDLYDQPCNYAVAKMLGNRSFLRGYCADNCFYWLNQVVDFDQFALIANEGQGHGVAAVTPNGFFIHHGGDFDIKGRVEKVTFGGTRYLITLATDKGSVELFLQPPQTIEVGDFICVDIDWNEAILFP